MKVGDCLELNGDDHLELKVGDRHALLRTAIRFFMAEQELRSYKLPKTLKQLIENNHNFLL